MENLGITEQVAGTFIRNALRGGVTSLLQVFKNDMEINNDGNEHKIFALARIIDQLRLGNHEVALEYCVHRLAGVHTADTARDWRTCEVIASAW
jgi:hypothetical protein